MKLFQFLGLCATFHQGQDHFRDFGSDGVSHRETRHTHGHQARKHISGQGLPHQGILHTVVHDTSIILPACMYNHGNQSVFTSVS